MKSDGLQNVFIVLGCSSEGDGESQAAGAGVQLQQQHRPLRRPVHRHLGAHLGMLHDIVRDAFSLSEPFWQISNSDSDLFNSIPPSSSFESTFSLKALVLSGFEIVNALFS